MKLIKNEKGITLVALIITIIVLLILAIVSIRAIKDGGILSKTQTAKEVYSESEEKEKIQLAINQAAIDGMGTINRTPLETALTEQFKDDFEITKQTEEYLKGKIKSSGRIYTINKNGNIGAVEEAIKLREGLKEGDEIELDADEDGTKETWIVLYKNTDNIEVISKNTMGELTLGKDDTEAQKAVPAVDENSLTDEEKIKRAIYSYNHAIERLNNYCASLIKIPNEGVRSVGTVPDDPSHRETSKPYETNPPANWTEEKIELLKYGEAADGNYLNDQKQMSKLNIIRSNDDNKYWLGSRYCTDGTGPRVDFNIRFSNFGEIDSNGVSLVKVYKDKAPRFIGGTYAVRPIIKLQYP